MPLRWHLDEFTSRYIAGWIDDDGPAPIDISVNGRIVATLLPTQYREDLERAGIGDGRRSFVFPLTKHLVEPNNIVTLSHQQEILGSKILQPENEEARIAALAQSVGLIPTQSKEIMFIQTFDRGSSRCPRLINI